MSKKILKIGSRGSLLAKRQTEIFGLALADTCSVDIDYVTLETAGDRKQSLSNVTRDKKDWIIDLEVALIAGKIDVAVHSAKDVPINIEPSTVLIPVLSRETPNDAVMFSDSSLSSFADLPDGSVIGTASLRRQAEIKQAYPNLIVKELRGNVTTRISRMENGDFQAIILAAAGLSRLGVSRTAFHLLSLDLFLPAVNQGILVAQCLAENSEILEKLRILIDRDTELVWAAERACLELLGADCHSSIGIFACRVSLEKFRISVKIFSIEMNSNLDSPILNDFEEFPPNIEAAKSAGIVLGQRLLLCGAKKYLNSIF